MQSQISKPKRRRTKFRCAICNRRLWNLDGRAHYIYSRFTGNRYCWIGEGCKR